MDASLGKANGEFPFFTSSMDTVKWCDEYQYDDDWVPISIIKTLTTSEYHKINLALLPDDKSRVEYIEDFTL